MSSFKIVAKNPAVRLPVKQAEAMKKVVAEPAFETKADALFYVKLLPAWLRDLLEVTTVLENLSKK